MFGSQAAYTADTRCACGRDQQESTVTTFRSVSGTYLFHRCPCGIEWTEHVAVPEIPPATNGPAVREFHEHVHAFHGAMRQEEARPAPRSPAPATMRAQRFRATR